MKRILVATNFSARAQRAVRRAGLLARDMGAELTLVYVVENKSGLVPESAQRDASRLLNDQADSMAELQGIRCRLVVAAGNAFTEIMKTAALDSADLIVMGAHRKNSLRYVFVGTTLERVMRTGPYPVLMVNKDVEQPYGNILAPVDMSEASARALAVGKTLGLVAKDRLTFVHAYEFFAKGKMFDADRRDHRTYMTEERLRANAELSMFLQKSGFDSQNSHRSVESGGAFEVIARTVEEMRPDLLILGTHGRSGIAKFFLGSVTEEALRTLDVDILAVPPLRTSTEKELSKEMASVT